MKVAGGPGIEATVTMTPSDQSREKLGAREATAGLPGPTGGLRLTQEPTSAGRTEAEGAGRQVDSRRPRVALDRCSHRFGGGRGLRGGRGRAGAALPATEQVESAH